MTQEKQIDRPSARLSLSYIFIAYLAFGLGALAGMVQGLVRGGITTLPSWTNYYQILTAHGVLMGLVFTTFFIIGFLFSGIAKTREAGCTQRHCDWDGQAGA